MREKQEVKENLQDKEEHASVPWGVDGGYLGRDPRKYDRHKANLLMSPYKLSSKFEYK